MQAYHERSNVIFKSQKAKSLHIWIQKLKNIMSISIFCTGWDWQQQGDHFTFAVTKLSDNDQEQLAGVFIAAISG